MKVTKQHKFLGGILLTGAIALVTDRVAFLKPEVAAAAPPAAEFVVPAASRRGVMIEPKLATSSISERLLAANNAGTNKPIRDAFVFGASWSPGEAQAAAPVAENTIEQFRQSHRLSGVLTSEGRSHAMVDGKIIVVGQELDGYRLVSISHRSATFEAGKSRIVLNMSERTGKVSFAGAAQ